MQSGQVHQTKLSEKRAPPPFGFLPATEGFFVDERLEDLTRGGA